MRKQKSLYLDTDSNPNPKSSYLKFLLNRSPKTTSSSSGTQNGLQQQRKSSKSNSDIPKISTVSDKINQFEEKSQLKEKNQKSRSFYASPKMKVSEDEKKYEKEIIQNECIDQNTNTKKVGKR